LEQSLQKTVQIKITKKNIMKKITLLLLLFVTVVATAQETATETKNETENETKHEIRLNTTNLIILKAFDVSYEYFINTEATVGTDLFISLDESNELYKNFSLTPYYRRYFSINAGAKTFFIEGFGMIYKDNETKFALGVSTGHKYVSNSGFVVQTHFGIGRSISSGDDFVARGGVSLGYQF